MVDADFDLSAPGGRLIYADWLSEQERYAEEKVQRTLALIESGEVDDGLARIFDAVMKHMHPDGRLRANAWGARYGVAMSANEVRGTIDVSVEETRE